MGAGGLQQGARVAHRLNSRRTKSHRYSTVQTRGAWHTIAKAWVQLAPAWKV
jgi:hypothetical protein